MKEVKSDDLMIIKQLEKEFGISKNTQAKLRMKINQGKPSQNGLKISL